MCSIVWFSIAISLLRSGKRTDVGRKRFSIVKKSAYYSLTYDLREKVQSIWCNSPKLLKMSLETLEEVGHQHMWGILDCFEMNTRSTRTMIECFLYKEQSKCVLFLCWEVVESNTDIYSGAPMWDTKGSTNLWGFALQKSSYEEGEENRRAKRVTVSLDRSQCIWDLKSKHTIVKMIIRFKTLFIYLIVIYTGKCVNGRAGLWKL